jgi:hypothetical protein
MVLAAALAAQPGPVPLGPRGPHRPSAITPATALGKPVGRLRCAREPRAQARAHLELFAGGRGVVVPAGLGLAPPVRREGAYVRGGRCAYPVRTHEPTGVLELAPGREAELGEVFALLGLPLSRRRMGAFRGPVRAWVNGRPWRASLRDLPLRPRAQIVVAAGTQRVPVHATYRFPPEP